MDETTPREMYFDDVKLQMDAKLWGEEYNRHNPPKKVDIFMMAVIELFERPGSPLYHIEHYIDGEYIKYNSNSGFVADQRQTPQAFSHFTFERSGHQLMVVDIQGVGDLYTDPQIHTAAGHEYGDGNLGTKVEMKRFKHQKIERQFNFTDQSQEMDSFIIIMSRAWHYFFIPINAMKYASVLDCLNLT